METETLIAKKDVLVGKFVAELTQIVQALHSKNKKDNDIIQIREYYMIAKNESSHSVVELTGPYIWKYRDELINGNIEELLKNKYTDEIIEYETRKRCTGDPANYMDTILFKIRNTWNTFSLNEKTLLKNKFKDMVSIYAGYLDLCKKIIKT